MDFSYSCHVFYTKAPLAQLKLPRQSARQCQQAKLAWQLPVVWNGSITWRSWGRMVGENMGENDPKMVTDFWFLFVPFASIFIHDDNLGWDATKVRNGMMELVEKGFPNFEHRMAAENRHEQLSPMDFPKAKSNFACSSMFGLFGEWWSIHGCMAIKNPGWCASWYSHSLHLPLCTEPRQLMQFKLRNLQVLEQHEKTWWQVLVFTACFHVTLMQL